MTTYTLVLISCAISFFCVRFPLFYYAPIAQWIEYPASNRVVGGSSPLRCVFHSGLMTKTPLFSHTHQSFVDYMYHLLGKGRQHAGAFYEETMRRGSCPREHSLFKNATRLWNNIFELTDLTVPGLVGERHDGTTGKFLLKTHDSLEIESVLIPMQSGGTLCLSSQVGCRMGCAFCETGRMGLLRNLKTEEIVGQVFAAKFLLGFHFRNVVFMGMGEPFDNYEEVIQAARVLLDPKGLGFGRKNITISTSGRVEEIRRYTQEGKWAPNLAVSINAPNDAIRNRLMPINRKHAMQELYEALLEYCRITERQILVAYVLMQDQNDTLEHAEQLAAYLRGLNVKINLIPYNPQSRDRYKPSKAPVLEAFAARLRVLGYYTLLRLTKGSKIMAACGQLGNLELRQRKKLVTCGLE